MLEPTTFYVHARTAGNVKASTPFTVEVKSKFEEQTIEQSLEPLSPAETSKKSQNSYMFEKSYGTIPVSKKGDMVFPGGITFNYKDFLWRDPKGNIISPPVPPEAYVEELTEQQKLNIKFTSGLNPALLNDEILRK